MKYSRLDIGFAAVAVVICTGFFRFLALPFGVPISYISGALMLFNLLYFIKYIPVMNFGSMQIFRWFVLLLAWPLVTFVYSNGGDLRAILLAFNWFLVFSGFVILIRRGKIKILRRLVSISLMITYIGTFLNLFQPELFNEVARLADAFVLTMGRPGGFYLQPNDLSINVVLLFAAQLALEADRSPLKNAVSAGLVVLVILLSGSRAGVILVSFVIATDLVDRFTKGVSRMRVTQASFWYVVCLTTMSVGVFFAANIFLSFFRKSSEVTPGGLVDRLDAFLSFRISYDQAGIETQSIAERWEAQLNYLRMIAESPLIGYGIGSERFFLNEGTLLLSSHSSFLSMALEYGIPYAIVFLVALVALLFSARGAKSVMLMDRSGYSSLVILATLLLLFSGGLVSRAPFFLFLSLAIAPLARVSETNSTDHKRIGRANGL